MKLYAPLIIALLAAPAFAQTATTESDGSTEAEDTLSLRAGTAFYSDGDQPTLRSPEEMQANWATLNAEDQAAIRARCETLPAPATEMQPSKGGDAADGATDGSTDADAASNDASGTTTAEDMGFMEDEARLREVCDQIANY